MPAWTQKMAEEKETRWIPTKGGIALAKGAGKHDDQYKDLVKLTKPNYHLMNDM